MSDEDKQRSTFRLGAFVVDPARNRLEREGCEYALEPRVMDVLCVLAGNGDRVTRRQELIQRLWPSQYGADEGLTSAVSSLRRAIREAGEADAYIETIPKRGYRLLEAAEAIGDGVAGDEEPEKTPAAEAPQASDGPQAGSHATPPLLSEQAGSRHRRFSRSLTLAALALVAALVLALAAATGILGRLDGGASGSTAGAQAPAERPDAAAARSVIDPAVAATPIAVLPFRPLTDNPADRYFGDGIAEELQQLLSRVTALRVMARASSFALDPDSLSVAEVGERLAVDYVVSGSVRRVGERVRVSARLLRAADGAQLWAETFDRELRDVFIVQQEIALSVANALQVRLDSQFANDLRTSRAIDPRAIELFYEALHHWSTRFVAKDGMRRPFDALLAAVDIDPGFAAAWALIGYFGVTLDGSPAANDRGAFTARTVGALDRALALEPDNALAHVGLALWKLQNDIDVEIARYHLERAVALRPRAHVTLTARLVFAWTLGEADESLRLLRRLKQRDPLNRSLELQHATVLAQLGRFDEAFVFLDECRETRCLGAGFLAYASTAAYMSGDEERIARWAPVAEEFLRALDKVPAAEKPHSARLLPAVFADWFGLPDAGQKLLDAIDLLASEPITDNIGIWGPTIARYATPDLMMDLLELAADRGQLLSEAYALSPFYGFHPYPESLLASPRYRRLWERDGLREIRELRREAGVPHGLPLK